MPGLVGCTKKTGSLEEVICGRKAISYANNCVNNEVFEDHNIICTRTHLNIIGEEISPSKYDQMYCWVEGEMYNIRKLKKLFNLDAKTEQNLLLEAYKKGILSRVLNQIDGLYVAVIYDKVNEDLIFVADRYGFKPLYIWKEEGYLAWSSEQKVFFNYKNFKKVINTKSLRCFLDNGLIIGTNTWFQNVNQVNASTLVKYSFRNKDDLTFERYWSWSDVKPIKVNFDDAVKEVGSLFCSSVQLLNEKNNRSTMIALSGGLDSRAILAATSKSKNIEAFTFGSKVSDDVKISKKIRSIRKGNYDYYELNKDNWFNNRIEAVWQSEAMVSFIHHHGISYAKYMRDKGEICINGFAAKVPIGNYKLVNINKRISENRSYEEFGDHFKLDHPNNSFYDYNKEAPYFINTRIKRFTYSGLNTFKNFENRIPFYNNELVEFGLGLTDHFRKDNHLYFSMLLNEFPEYFNKIPWQESGIPISGYLKCYYRPKRIAQRVLSKFKYETIGYANYNSWINNKRNLISSILASDKAIVPQMIKRDIIPEVKSFKNINRIALLFTAEIWMQQIFNQRFYTTEEFLSYEY